MATRKNPAPRQLSTFEDLTAAGIGAGYRPYVGFQPEDAGPEAAPERSMSRAVADTALEVVSGAAKGVKFMTDVVGANNTASRGLDAVSKFAKEWQSAQAKGEDQRMGEIMRAAEDQGAWEQVKAALSAAGEAPFRQSIGALATGAPIIAASMLPGLREAAWTTRIGAMGAMGAAQGTGMVKSSIYEAVYQRAIQEGRTEQEARALAEQQQSYAENPGLLAGAGALGAGATVTGFAPAVLRAMGGGAASGAAGAAAPGLVRSLGAGIAKEVPLEAAQGGQEQYASNVAQDQAGFDTPYRRGVVGSATMEGALSVLGGTAGGGIDYARGRADPALPPGADPALPPVPPAGPPPGPMTRALGAGAPFVPPPSLTGNDPASLLAGQMGGLEGRPDPLRQMDQPPEDADPLAGMSSPVRATYVDASKDWVAGGKQGDVIRVGDGFQFAPEGSPELAAFKERVRQRTQAPASASPPAGSSNDFLDGLPSFEPDETAPPPSTQADATPPAADPMYQQAADYVKSTNDADIGWLQGNFGIGYNRAARLLEDMETAGLVSAMDSDGARTVLKTQTPGALRTPDNFTGNATGSMGAMTSATAGPGFNARNTPNVQVAPKPAAQAETPRDETPAEAGSDAAATPAVPDTGRGGDAQADGVNADTIGLAVYQVTKAPAYEDVPPLDAADVDFQLEVMGERAAEGKLTPAVFAQSDIGQRIEGAALAFINKGLRSDPVGTINALRSRLAQSAAPTTQEPQKPQTGAKQADGVTLQDGYGRAVKEWNALVEAYKAANPQDQEAMKPQMESVKQRMEQARQDLMQEEDKIFKQGQAKAANEARAAAKATYGAMNIGARIGVAGSEKNDSVYWEKTGPDQWTRKGMGSSEPTKTSSEMEGSRVIVAGPKAVASTPTPQNTRTLGPASTPAQPEGATNEVPNESTNEGTQQEASAEAKPVLSGESADAGLIGRNNVPMADGGKPFKTRLAAGNARRLQTAMRVKPVKGGFVLRPQTEKEGLATQAAARRLGGAGQRGLPEAAHELIASKGGLSKSTMADLGFDTNVRVGARWLFAGNGGMTLEQATEALQQDGFMDGTDQNRAIELIQRSARGNPQYTPEGYERIAQAQANARFEDHLTAQQEAAPAMPDRDAEDYDPFSDPSAASTEFDADTLADAGYDDLTPTQQDWFDALTAAAQADGIDVGSIREQAFENTRNGTDDDFRNETRTLIEAARSERAVAAEQARVEQGRQDAGREDGGRVRQGDGAEGAAQPVAPPETALARRARLIAEREQRGEPAAKPRKVSKKQAEIDAAEQARADYFTPGNILKSGNGEFDEVLAYTPNADGGFKVRVQPVKEVDGQWQKSGNWREHSTPPDRGARPHRSAVERGVAPVAAPEASVPPARKEESALQSWQTAIPDKGLPVEPGDEKLDGARNVVSRIANDAFNAITQNQRQNGAALYLYVKPSTDKEHGIARLFPDDQTPPGPWSLVDPGALRLGFMTNEQAAIKIGSLLGNSPILSTGKVAEAANVPPAVRATVTRALGRLRDIESLLKDVERARGRGHVLKTAWDEQQEKIKDARDRLDKFKAIAKEKGIDADALIKELGGEPDLERYNVTPVKSEPRAPEPKAPRIVTPQTPSGRQLKSFIGVASDSVEQLRRADVERVLRETPEPFLLATADFIKGQRPDLADEVADVIAELNAEKAEAPILTAPTRKEIEAQQDRTGNADKLDAKDQIRRESEVGDNSFMTGFSGDNRQDNTGSLFDAPVESDATPAAPAKPQAAAPKAEAPKGKVEDFGEKLPPARRAMAAQLGEELTDEKVSTMPLSQIWPAAQNEAIEETFPAAVAHVMREAIPAKPRVPYKVNSWVGKVKVLRDFAAKVLSGKISKEKLMGELEKVRSLSSLGAKIKLLEQLERKDWGRVGDVSEAPNAIRYDSGVGVPQPSVSVSIDGKNHWLQGSGDLNDHITAITIMLQGDAPDSKMQFEIRSKATGENRYFINKKGDKEYRPLMRFATLPEARAALKDQYAEVVAAWENVKGRDNITERDLRSEENRPRAGQDWRKGKDVSAEEFQSTFGFRGGEFGKWVSQGKGAQERQFFLNSAYDALMDLSNIIGVPPKAISLDGTLGIAFGSRGSGWASAHFEPSNLVISLTKPRGAGALAHEWFHAMDNYFARKRGGEVPFSGDNNAYRNNNYITHKTTPMMVRKDSPGSSPVTKERLAEWTKGNPGKGYLNPDNWMTDPNHKAGVRAEVEERFENLVRELDKSPMLQRARTLEGSKDGDGYWSRTIERAARSFENYVQTRMMEQGYHNDFLANVKAAPEVGKNESRYPYLLPSEIAPVADAFASLFSTIQTKDNADGSVAMFSRSSPGIRPAIDAAIDAREKYEAIDRKAVAESGSGADYFAAIDAQLAADAALAQALNGMPDSGFALQGKTSDGRVLMLNASAQQPGKWQVTRFDPKGEPWGDTNYDTKRQAISEFLREVDLASLQDMDGAFSRANPKTNAIGQPAVTQIIDAIRARWANAPEIVVVADMNDPAIPKAVRDADAAQRSQGATGEPEGFFYGGKVYVVASAMQNPRDVVRVLFHESLGHAGLRGVFGDALNPILQQIVALRRTEVAAKAKEYGLDMSKEADRLQAAEEVLAVMAQSKPELGFVKRAIAAIRAFLRKNVPGFADMKLTDAEIIQQYILPARAFVERGGAGAARASAPAFGRGAADQTDTPAFKAWFGDSKVVDADGKPLVVYHGTNGDFNTFDAGELGAASGAASAKMGFFFASNPAVASSYADTFNAYKDTLFGRFVQRLTGGLYEKLNERMLGKLGRSAISEGGNVMPLYLSISNPMVVDFGSSRYRDQTYAKVISDAKAAGHDGVILRNTFDEGYVDGGEAQTDVYVAFNPTQIKSATGNNGNFDPANPDIRFSRTSPVGITQALMDAIPSAVSDRLADISTSQRGFNRWWHRTVGTQFHKAKINAEYGRVYYAVQDFMKDVSRMATLAADQAPDLLPQVDTPADIKKILPDLLSNKQRKADLKASSDALFDGTLRYTRDEDGNAIEVQPGDPEPGGLVWTNAELIGRGMNEKSRAMYRQARAAIDQSLDNLMASDVYRMMTSMKPEMYADTLAQSERMLVDVRKAAATDNPDAAVAMLKDGIVKQEQRVKSELQTQRAALTSADGTEKVLLQSSIKRTAENLNNIIKAREQIEKKQGRIADLKAAGYAPLSRFGQYTLDVMDGPDRVFFGLYESQFAANQAARKFSQEGLTVRQGIKSQKEFELLKGISPETAMLFADLLGVEQSAAMQAWLQNAVAEQSALKRHIRRKGVAGFDNDASRVVASFLTSNSRAASRALHGLRIQESVESIQGPGDVKDEAIALVEYVQNPVEEAQAIRSLLFINYIGGSVSSALVNLTQTVVQTFPYLAQHGGARKSAARVGQAMKMAVGEIADPALAAAVKRAELEGVIKPQEVYQLQAEASRTLGSNLRWRAAISLWGSFFQMAEQYNRRVAFIAGYQTALAQNIANPYAFAESTVEATQGTFNKGNRPDWARGAVGATIFTFKSFTIQYVEFLKRLPPKERAIALAVLMMLAGASGLPFAEDLEDLIDTVAQALGYNFTTKIAKDRFLVEHLGRDFASFLQHGASGTGMLPFDVSARLGMADLLPGTGLLKAGENKQNQVLEVFGVAGSYVRDALKGEMRPIAIRNASKGWDMYSTGIFTDTRGRKVMDASPVDAAMRSIGLQPAGVARESRAVRMQYELRAPFTEAKREITEQIALGMFEDNPAKIKQAREKLDDWNRKNPEARIMLNSQSIRRRVVEMRKDRKERFLKSTPRELRASTREAIQ